jgi:hypothetical protein
MNIIVNYWAILGGAVFLFIMGFVWYGPLFGKRWMKITGGENMSKEEMAEAMKGMTTSYILIFFSSLATSYVLYHFVKLLGNGVEAALWIWLGFAMPMAAGAMFDTKKGLILTKFLIVAGFQLITLVVLGWGFTMW